MKHEKIIKTAKTIGMNAGISQLRLSPPPNDTFQNYVSIVFRFGDELVHRFHYIRIIPHYSKTISHDWNIKLDRHYSLVGQKTMFFLYLGISHTAGKPTVKKSRLRN